MNPEVKQKWIEALESGQYKHGKGLLRNGNNEFCALGVLCDIYAQEHNEPWLRHSLYEFKPAEKPSLQFKSVEFGLLGYTTELPVEVATWAGLVNNQDFQDELNNCQSFIAAENDNSDSFAEVIQAIKKYL